MGLFWVLDKRKGTKIAKNGSLEAEFDGYFFRWMGF